MGDTRFGQPAEENLDWNNLDAPVPMDLIDPEFRAHKAEDAADLAAQAAARATEAAAVDSTQEMTQRFPTPAQGTPIAAPASGAPNAPPPGATLFGGTDALQDEFARIRAEMEAEAQAEKSKKAAADKEEASQRERLEQWMANARARLLKADADLAGPSARIRIRKDSSPSLYRLAEMQKTIYVEGEATQADGTVRHIAPPAPSALDPMATISVPTEQFLTLDAPAQPTMREQALARQAQQQAAQVAAVQAAETAAGERAGTQSKSARKALAKAEQLQNTTAFTPMTREEALTRKVAKLRRAADVGDNTLAVAPQPGEIRDERFALNFAIAAVVVVAILVLGLGLFAATQAGLFDGLENRIPVLKPKIAVAVQPVGPAPAPSAGLRNPAPDPAPAVRATTTAPASAGLRTPVPAPVQVPPGNQPAPKALRNVPATPAPAHAPVAARPAKPVAKAPAKPAKAAKPGTLSAAEAFVLPPEARPPAAAKPSKAATAAAKARKAAQAAAEAEGDIPSYAKPRSKAANLAEIILRASVQAASNIDKDNLLEMYNRYALAYPGLSGEVVIGLTIDPGGRILEGSIVSSTTGAEAFDQELLRKVLDWRLRSFPDSRPKFITVPFLFPMQGH